VLVLRLDDNENGFEVLKKNGFDVVEDFEDLKKFAKKEKAPIFYTPNEAAYAIKILVERL